MMVTKIVVRQSLHPFPRPDTHKKNTPCRWLGVCSRWFTNMAQQFLRECGLSTSTRNWDTIIMLLHSCCPLATQSDMDIRFCHEISRTKHNITNAGDPDTRGKRVCGKTVACITTRLVGTFTAAIAPTSVKCPSIDLHGPFDDVFRLEAVFHGQVRVGVLHQPVSLAWSIFSHCHAAHTEIVTMNRSIPCC